MAKLRSYGILTGADTWDAEHTGKYIVANNLCCPFCEEGIRTEIGESGNELPFCYTCGVFLMLVWELRENHLQVRFVPSTKDVKTGENDILQSTGNDIYVPKQRSGTIADEILAYLNQHRIAETAELRQATQSSTQGFNLAIKKLIDAGQVRKVKRGWYERITADATS